MFYEVKPYQVIKLEDVIGFATYPDSEYGDKNLYIHMRGLRESLRFTFGSEHSCKFAYRRLRKALIDAGYKMEDYDNESYL